VRSDLAAILLVLRIFCREFLFPVVVGVAAIIRAKTLVRRRAPDILSTFLALHLDALCVGCCNQIGLEGCYDHFTGERFRHGTRLLRWRPDKTPKQCTTDQIRQKKAKLMALLD
jgi:hypothetical protein